MSEVLLSAAKEAMVGLSTALSLSPLPAVIGLIPSGVILIIDIAQTVRKNKEDAKDLALYVAKLAEAILTPIGDKEINSEMETQLELLMLEMGNVQKNMKKLASRNLFKRIFTSADDTVKVAAFQAKIQSVLAIFNVGNAVSMRLQMEAVSKGVKDVKSALGAVDNQKYIDKLGSGDNGSADGVTDATERTCSKETRVRLMDHIASWYERRTLEDKDRRVFWLTGVAGSGKSTVAATMDQSLEEHQQLGAAFYFSRGHPDRNKRAVLVLAGRLSAWQEGLLRPHIAEAIKRNPNIVTAPPAEQYEKLIRQPLQHLPADPHASPLVFILDAMDEAEDAFATKLIELIGKDHDDLPRSVKFLITSRVEQHLQVAFDSTFDSDPVRSMVKHHAMDDEDPATVEEDIERYLRERLPTKVKMFGIQDAEWPGQVKRHALVEMAQRLFIWAATAALFIADPKFRDPEAQLEVLFADSCALKGLDDLYESILGHAFPVDVYESIVTLLRDVLGTLVVARTPIHINTLTQLLHPGTVPTELQTVAGRIRIKVLVYLQSVLIIPGVDHPGPVDENRPITFLHPSFVDFLTTPGRCSARFHIDPADYHERMAKACLLRMRDLKRNICDLQDHSLLNSEVENLEGKVKETVSSSLQYACRYLGDHLARTKTKSEELGGLLRGWAEQRFLYWMEVMSLMDATRDAPRIIGEVLAWLLIEGNQITDARVLELLRDAQQFVTEFAEVISTSALHIYLSALPFTPRETAISRVYREQTTGGLKVLRGLQERWYQSAWVAKSHTGPITCVAFSTDSTTVISGSEDHTLRLSEVATGAPVGKSLEGHTHDVTCIAVSPHGRVAVSGSRDLTLRRWDMETGEVIGQPVTGYEGEISCIAFSSDGRILVSGASDGTLRLWDMETEQPVAEPLVHHSGWTVNCIAFSPDGTTLVSGCGDKTLRLWEVRTGAASGGPLEGHTASVYCCIFTSNGEVVVSGGDDGYLHIWDVKKGDAHREPILAHTARISSLRLSPDGGVVASASHDCTIRLWNAENFEAMRELRGHGSFVTSLAFSPTGNIIATGSRDATLRLWDVASGAPIGKPLEGHTGWVRCIAFSSDGRAIASGCQDSTVRLWDVTNAYETKTMEEQPRDASIGAEVISIAFSPNRTFVATGSKDDAIGLWDAATGASISQPLEGRCIEISPNSTVLASGCDDHGIRLWDVKTGRGVGQPLVGHDEVVSCLAFSPDGTILASGSEDCTVRLWSVPSGSPIGDALKGHRDQVQCVAFSPDGKTIATGSDDNTVCLWDVTRRTLIGQTPTQPSQSGLRRLAWNFGKSLSLGEGVKGHTRSVKRVAFSPCGSIVASASTDATIRLWGAVTGASLGDALLGHWNPRILTFLDHGSFLVAAGSGEREETWDLTTRSRVTKEDAVSEEVEKELSLPSSAVDEDGWVWSLRGRRLFWLPGRPRTGPIHVAGDLMVVRHANVAMINFSSLL